VIAAWLFAAGLAANSAGCIIVPTPTHGIGIITEETIRALSPGKTTRIDVLLSLADPAERIDGDRWFVYRWQETHAYGAVGAFPAVLPFELGDAHAVVFEFDAAGVLIRKKAFEAGPPNSEKKLERSIGEWRASPEEKP
jgi:hypothetical protein